MKIHNTHMTSMSPGHSAALIFLNKKIKIGRSEHPPPAPTPLKFQKYSIMVLEVGVFQM